MTRYLCAAAALLTAPWSTATTSAVPLAVVAAIVAVDLLAVFALMASAKRADAQAERLFRPLVTPVPPPLPRRAGFAWDGVHGHWVPLEPLLGDLRKATTVDDVLGAS